MSGTREYLSGLLNLTTRQTSTSALPTILNAIASAVGAACEVTKDVKFVVDEATT